jgi:hypothetical protein
VTKSEHKMGVCSMCSQSREMRHLKNSLCVKCAKTESKSVINVATEPLTKPLTSHNLNVLLNDVVAKDEV